MKTIPFNWTKYKNNKFATLIWAFLVLLVRFAIGGIVVLILGIINGDIVLVLYGAAFVILGVVSYFIFIPKHLANLEKRSLE